MIGILVILTLSAILIHIFQKKNLLVLGVLPLGGRLVEFVIGFIFVVVLQIVIIGIDMIVLSSEWELSDHVNLIKILESFWYHFKSALFEDLVFRGVILYILLQRLKTQPALILSALSFGIYHIFSYGMIHSGLIQILYIVMLTGIMGYVWAYAFERTGSIMLGLGFHLSWNFTNTLCYDTVPFGQLLLKSSFLEPIANEWIHILYQLLKAIIPALIIYGFIRFLDRKKKRLRVD